MHMDLITIEHDVPQTHNALCIEKDEKGNKKEFYLPTPCIGDKQTTIITNAKVAFDLNIFGRRFVCYC